MHDVVVRADQPLDDPVAGGPTGRIEHRVIESEELRDRLFELAASTSCCPAKADEPALWTPYSSMTALATSFISGSDDRPR